MKILDYHSPVTPFTVYIIGDYISISFKYAYKLPHFIAQGYRAMNVNMDTFREVIEFLFDNLGINQESFIGYMLSAYEENKKTYQNEANNIDITLLTERQINLVACQTTNIRIMKQLLKYKKDLSFYGLVRNPNTPSKIISKLIKSSECAADSLASRKYPFNEQHIEIIGKKYPDLLTRWFSTIDADQALMERCLAYIDSEKIYTYMVADKLPQYFHEYAIMQKNNLMVNDVISASPNITFIVKHLDMICRDKE